MNTRFVDGHHLRHWADGGATRLDNLMLLCRHHHRQLHEGGYYVVKDGANFIFCRGDGVLIEPRNETSMAALIARAADNLSQPMPWIARDRAAPASHRAAPA